MDYGATAQPELVWPGLGTHQFDAIERGGFDALWVVDFPMFTWDKDEERYDANHHPFTMVFEDHVERIESEPLEVLSHSYDLIINGYEIGGGTLRIHDAALQRRVLARLGLSEDELARLEGQLNHILDQYAVLAELDTEHIAPTAQTIELENILRDDEVRPGLTSEEILALAPERAGQYFLVPPILGEHGN